MDFTLYRYIDVIDLFFSLISKADLYVTALPLSTFKLEPGVIRQANKEPICLILGHLKIK